MTINELMVSSLFIKIKKRWSGRLEHYWAPFILIQKLSTFGVDPCQFFLKASIGAIGKLVAVAQFGIFYKVLNAIIQSKKATLYQGMMGSFLTYIIPDQYINTNCVWAVMVIIALCLKGFEIFLSYHSEKYIFDAHKELEMSIQHKVLKKTLELDLVMIELQNAKHKRTWAENVDLIIRKTQLYSGSLKTAYQLYMKGVTVIGLSFLMIFLQYKFFLFAVTVMFFTRIISVSYTHLTLPTIYSV